MNPLKHQSTPRWIILVIDFFLIQSGFFLAYLLRFNFDVPTEEWSNYQWSLPFYSLTYLITFLVMKTYAGVIRHTDSEELFKIIQTALWASAILLAANWIYYLLVAPKFFFPHSVLIIQFLANVAFLLGFRFFVRWLYLRITNPIRGKKAIAIYGAGEAGLITKKTIERDVNSKMRVVAFLDDNHKLHKKKLGGIEIWSPKKLSDVHKKYTLANLILSIDKLAPSEKQDILNQALSLGIEIQRVPPVNEWIQGELSTNQIRKIRIEDLLGRASIHLDPQKVSHFLDGKKILVTGAAGSIGSEIARQLLTYPIQELILLDQAESPIYDLQHELSDINPTLNPEYVIANVSDPTRMAKVFRAFQPHIVFHAAAYKHVPLMENNPAEAIRVNTLGTKFLADLSDRYQVEKFVMVSTDKAVNPTNVMGASKRAAEMYVQSLNTRSQTEFITTRFGNVLGSNGSVIPLFKKQIEHGGPVTVTHPEITRFFMTIPEACSLVIEAGALGNGGEIFVFDMGESIRIVDLAKKMIELSGLVLDRDIEIKYTGLREGEKLYEELLTHSETTKPTHHPKIMIADVALPTFARPLSEIFDEMVAELPTQQNNRLVQLLKSFIPEFKSNNSIFERLDTPKGTP